MRISSQPDAYFGCSWFDDHETFAQSLAMALDAKPDCECVATASSGPLALDLIIRTPPDVVVLDLELGADSGWTSRARSVRRRRTP
jgi:DNA-binding NarL/FixJ family response regulator